MAQSQEPKAGEKRGPGRPPRTATPAAKKQKTAAPTPPAFATPVTRSPAVDSPAPEKKGIRLPSKIADSKPLPTVAEPQPAHLPSEEYQNIAASNVLAAAIDRSRQKWICEGIFKRYWVKPEKGTGKNAKPQPPNNPEVKWMKGKGECRIRLEPHLLVAQVFVEERPRPKQNQPIYGQYGQQQYRPPQSQPYLQHSNQQFQNRPVPPVSQPGTPQSMQNVQPLMPQQPPQRPPAASPPASGQQDKKNPDPVISMLASRASSDPELKALMKEVATGNATSHQLKVFQRHIDELGAIISKQKGEREDQPQPPQQSNGATYDGAVDQRPQLQPQPRPQPIQPQHPPPRAPYPAQTPYTQQPQWTPPTNLPVILEFQTQGATEDRFLFPEYSILEPLSPQHELVSFVVVRKGRNAVDSTGLDPERDYWQPVTMMVEVAYGREEIMNCIRRWVKPAAEVQKYMEDVMKRCRRAPESYLALRLPHKGSAMIESGEASKEATPISLEERAKPKAAVRSISKKAASKPDTAVPVGTSAKKSGEVSAASTASTATSQPTLSADDAASTTQLDDKGAALTTATATGALESPATTDNSRPRRAHRKSVRISDG
ncbi:Hypothetical predicted protein [Lecanosticta acicola]|uniref:SWR1-complex protein 3 domain-containing protein n=1 Tax=Lecanosticta acicola TaxID=111012 RepID=A0AAI9EBT4_9PEZI|nr:Hypothetical predicted protein [Lecanosticta acicola]